MSVFRVLFELFVLYLLYKLVFDFIIPIYQTTKSVKQKMTEMHQRMNEQAKQQQPSQYQPTKETSPKPGKEDYIEFEEVK
jgi:sortase (surface protein transpeptidase)